MKSIYYSLIAMALLTFIGCTTGKDINEAINEYYFPEETEGKFLGVMGYALVVPGVENYHNTYKGKIDVLVIPGTSDAIESKQQIKYNAADYEHAFQHNLNLLEEINQNNNRSCRAEGRSSD